MSQAARYIPALFVALWATGFIGARYAMPWAEPFWFLAARFALTILVLAAIAVPLRARMLSRRAAFDQAVAGFLMHGVYLGGVFWAIDNGMPAGLSALLVGLQPLITAVAAGRLLNEPVTARHWAGLFVGFAGVALVLSPKLAEAGGGVTPVNVAACTLAVLGMTAGTIWQKRFGGRTDLVAGTAWQYVGGGLTMLVMAVIFETGNFTLTGELVFAMLWLVLVLSVGAIFLLMFLIRQGAVSRVASLFYLVPGVTALIAWALFDETLSPLQLVGMAVAAGGVWLAAQPGTRARASE
ncbi:DMT family transporter [Mesorhizobium sp. Z1-4]|uniref:DMT family transporter n=1 Tax=Mesorhizobium sp. Z1-4 TaxID=2448478 RepID=UPI000FD6E81E|nr:DMT family transporter [Mesorhizobium sp. Z1-4]